MVGFWNRFTKITAWPVQKIVFRTRIFYENKAEQGRRIKEPAIVICNHTSVWDFAVLLFVFRGRTVRYQMAEVLFEKKLLGIFLKMLGGIVVDRKTRNFSFINRSEDILKKGGAVGIFPESRLPIPGEERPLPFKPSTAFLALAADVPVIPVYTNGSYFRRKRAAVIIGKPINVYDFVDEKLSEKENIDNVTSAMRKRIIELGEELNRYEKSKTE
ncbi:MAG: lysophospholipid acyltransferase family protein [Eubacteriales bacterium]